MNWDYKIVNLETDSESKDSGTFLGLKVSKEVTTFGESAERTLSTLGAQGWELVSVVGITGPHYEGSTGTTGLTAFLKRPKA